jgi:hypothetical protein
LGALIAAQGRSAVDPSISPPSGPDNTIQQWVASLVADGNGQIGQLPQFSTGATGTGFAAGHWNLSGINGNTATGAGTNRTEGTGSSTPSGNAGGSTDTGGTSTDPQGQTAGASSTVANNADGSTTRTFTLADGKKITLVTVTPPPLPQGTSIPRPPNFANLSFSQIEQWIQSEARSLSAFAFPSFSVNA